MPIFKVDQSGDDAIYRISSRSKDIKNFCPNCGMHRQTLRSTNQHAVYEVCSLQSEVKADVLYEVII